MSMDPARYHTNERILNLALEIIYLLTGEDYGPVNKRGHSVALNSDPHVFGGWSRRRSLIPVPTPHSLTHERHNEQKILELTNKMIELLTGENLEDVEDYTHMTVDVKMQSCPSQWPLDGAAIKNHLDGSQSSADGGTNGSSDLKGDDCTTRAASVRNGPDDAASKEDIDLTDPMDNPECVPVLIKDELAFCEAGDLAAQEVETQTEVRLDYSSDDMKDERVSVEEESSTEPETLEYSLVRIKEESDSYEEMNMADPDAFLNTSHKPEEQNALERCKSLTAVICGDCGKRFETNFPERLENYKCQTCSGDLIHDQVTRRFVIDSSLGHEGREAEDNNHGQSLAKATQPKGQKGNKAVLCPICEKWFSNSSNLVNHKRIHTGEKLFTCSDCGKSFNKKANFDIHQRIHTGEKPFFCPQCGKGFRSKYYLTSHEKVHTKTKPYTCLDCGRGFARSPNLVRHQKVHTGEKPYSCTQCGKGFAQRSYLEAHQRIHTGEKPFSCTECGRCFAHYSSLSVHEKCHKNEKPFSCEECGKCFTHLTTLRVHEKRHTNEKPFSCSECGKSFLLMKYLKRHIKVHRDKHMT